MSGKEPTRCRHWAELVTAALYSQEDLCEAKKAGLKRRGWPEVTAEENAFSVVVCSEHWSFLL